jgi:hypothetical protein
VEGLEGLSKRHRSRDDEPTTGDLRAQCLFVGHDETNPNHVAIIANGNGVTVHHCVFRGLKISVVYWTPGSSGHAMTNCLCASNPANTRRVRCDRQS